MFLGVFVLLVAIGGGSSQFLNASFFFSVLQLFATVGPIALGVGMTMLIREFDLSVAGMVGMAGCIAVLTGGSNPSLGLAAALGVGLVAGLFQGWIVARLKLSSIGVTLGGLLVFFGVSYALTESRSIEYPNLDVAAMLGRRMLGIFTIPSLTVVIIYGIHSLGVWRDKAWTRSCRCGRRSSRCPFDRRSCQRPFDRDFWFFRCTSGVVRRLAGIQLGFGSADGTRQRSRSGNDGRHSRGRFAVRGNRPATWNCIGSTDIMSAPVGIERPWLVLLLSRDPCWTGPIGHCGAGRARLRNSSATASAAVWTGLRPALW